MRKLKNRSDGFSLVELAVVLLIVSFLVGSLIAAFRAQLAFTRGAQAREQIREAREALLNFAIAQQRLPCPAAPGSGGSEISAPECNLVFKGELPWRTLGLASTDPWGQPLHYAVTRAFVTPGFALSTVGSLTLLSGADNLDAARAVAFSVWTVGEDASDASTINGAAAPPIDGNTVVAEAPGSDDIVEWVSRYVLFGKMLAAGRSLPLSASSSSASSAASSAAGG